METFEKLSDTEITGTKTVNTNYDLGLVKSQLISLQNQADKLQTEMDNTQELIRNKQALLDQATSLGIDITSIKPKGIII